MPSFEIKMLKNSFSATNLKNFKTRFSGPESQYTVTFSLDGPSSEIMLDDGSAKPGRVSSGSGIKFGPLNPGI